MKREGVADTVRRIEQVRMDKGLSARRMCQKAEIVPTTYSNYIIRGGEPSPEMLEKIARVLGVSALYLKTGKEVSDNLGEEMTKLAGRIAQLPEEQQAHLIGMYHSLIDTLSVKKE